MVVLITATGCRPAQFKICAELMKRQTYKGEVLWVIVDDGAAITTDVVPDDFREGWHIMKVYPEPKWQFGMNTQGRNLREGIEAMWKEYHPMQIDAFFIIEDDDWYAPTYLEYTLPKLKGYLAAGEVKTLYYNVVRRDYHINQNERWSSLFQTVFSIGALDTFIECIDEKFIDFIFFRKVESPNLYKGKYLSIGMKGMPGRAGIGAGHGNTLGMLPDHDMSKIKKAIGDDYKFYEGYYQHYGQPQYKDPASASGQ